MSRQARCVSALNERIAAGDDIGKIEEAVAEKLAGFERAEPPSSAATSATGDEDDIPRPGR